MSFDLGDYIESSVPFVKYSKHYQIDCLDHLCEDSWQRKKHCYVYIESSSAHCFKCGRNFKPLEIVMLAEGVSYGKALQIIHNLSPRRLPSVDAVHEAWKKYLGLKDDVPDEIPKVELPKTVSLGSDLGRPGLRYLVRRGFGADVVRHFRLSYCPVGDFGSRVIIPVHSSGCVVGFQGRDVTGRSKLKYRFPKGAGHANHLYNWDNAKNFESVVLVEGVTDAWRLWMSGVKNVAATWGKSLKTGQRKAILSQDNVKEVIIFWDGNALKEAFSVAEYLSSFVRVRVAELPEEMEPDTCPDIDKYLLESVVYQELSAVDVKRRRCGL